MSARGAWFASIGLVVSVLLLGAGWLARSIGARDAALRAERSRLEGTLDRARSAVDAAMRELVAREDERPFYEYSHYYSPPDVLSLNDPVALSPIASEPGDARIVGHFELDPDGTLRTPYSVDPGPATDRARRVLDALDGATRSTLRAELGGHDAGALVASAPVDDALQNPLANVGNVLALEIAQAQQGDVAAYQRVQLRGRAVPRVARRDVETNAVTSDRSEPPIAPTLAAPTLPPLVQGEIEVDYTPMRLRALGDHALLLSRVVSRGGAGVVDGVVLDRDRIEGTWMAGTIARAATEDAPVVIRSSSTVRCAARAAASAWIPGVDLCASSASLDRVSDEIDGALRLEIGLLVGLLALAGIAATSIVRAMRRADELSRQKSAFVSAVSHELRTPLTTLRMHAEMLDEGMVPPERREKVHAELATETARLSRIVENVLEISRLEEGKRPLRATRADLSAHVRSIVELQRAHARGKNFDLELALPETAVVARFDATAIEQIVTNAVDNALKYAASAADRRIEISLVLATRGERAGVEVRVGDHGPGVPAVERARVFERFYRVEREDTAHQPGTGLGLALVRELARAHDGDASILASDDGLLLAVWLPIG
jgi:signal transduction histidine kinase